MNSTRVRAPRRGLIVVLAALVIALTVTAVPQAVAAPPAPSSYIVQLADPPLASYRGGIPDLAPTNPGVLGQVKLDVDSPSSTAYLEHLTVRHDAARQAMASTLARDVAVRFDYRYAFNGIAVELTEAEAGVVRGLDGVIGVQPDFERRIVTDAGPAWMGAPNVWDGTATGGAPGSKGEGVVVGVIDTGVNFDHPSFADTGGDGYDHDNPRGRFYGLCAPVGGLPFCNDKLIGAHDFTGTTPHDDNGHGSHTASTAAGNALAAEVVAPTTEITRNISGVAPHANLITYKACLAIGSCVGTSLVAAIDQATADEVDVINYSIGGGPVDPWNDADSQAFLGARDAGVFAAVSAGNSGPGAGTVGSPANSPWVLSVGASTHDRAFRNSVVDLAGGDSAPPGDIVGAGFTSGYGPAPIVHAEDYGDPLCGAPFPPGTFDGQIVVCERGVNPRVEKGRNVEVGGAGGMVLANTEAEGDSTVADAHELPAVHIGFADATELAKWMSSGSGHRATIAGTTADRQDANGDVMAGFSSRGPNPPVPGVIKPDVTAPGVDILAAVHTTNPLAPPEFGLLSGTSMSSPHSAGAAALVRAVHPEWTPAQVQSALTSTGLTDGVRKEDGETAADPFDLGGGRVDLTRAARAGLLLDETGTGYQAANPQVGGDPSELNLATLADQDCKGRCTWVREVTNELPTAASWRFGTTAPEGMELSVKPRQIRLAPGESALVTVTADVGALPSGSWAFGRVDLAPRNSVAAPQHLTVAALPGGAPQPITIDTGSSSGSHTETLQAPVDITNFDAAVLGLQAGTVSRQQAPQDPTPLDPYDGSPGTVHTTVQVPDAAPLLLAEITDTTSSDADLYVGLDADGDGAPDSGEEVCRSASERSAESCRLEDPAAGTYWVMASNFLTGRVVDDITLATTVIPATDNGNLTVTGPQGRVRADEPFTVDLAWKEPAMTPGTTWSALVRMGSDREHEGDVGSLLVTIRRAEG